MKNQIKNDLNNIKNSGQIVINTAISNDNGSRQYRASDVIEKGKSTNFMAVYTFVAYDFSIYLLFISRV